MKIQHKFSSAQYAVALAVLFFVTALFLYVGYRVDDYTSGITGSTFVLYSLGYAALSHLAPGTLQHMLTTDNLSNAHSFVAFAASMKYTLSQMSIWDFLQINGPNLKAYFIYFIVTTLIFWPLFYIAVAGVLGLKTEIEMDPETAREIMRSARRASHRQEY